MSSFPTSIVRTLLASTLALLLGQLGGSTRAHASCVAPELQLLWSYPEPGAEQVPTNAVLWAVTNTWGAKPNVTLDGEALDPPSAPTFSGVYLQPDELSANSEHTLVLDYTHSPNPLMSDAQRRFEIKFKTGPGRAEGRVAEATITGSTRVTADFLDHDCAEVIAAQDCFDTGQNALLSVEIAETPDETLGWLLQTSYHGSSAIWPARCGAPSVYIHEQESLCHRVQRIGAGGRLSEAVEHCSAAKSQPMAPGPTGGLQGTAGETSPSTVSTSVANVDAASGGAGSAGSRASTRETQSPAAQAPSANTGCSTISGGRTAARAFWAIVAIALLLAHHQRHHHRKRPRGCTPSRRFRL